MTARELEQKYWPHLRKVGSLRLFPAEVAIRLLQESAFAGVRLLGVGAFRIFEDGKVQPAMEFSNISYGRFESGDFHPQVDLREPWSRNPNALRDTEALIAAGVAEGYSWYEVLLEECGANDRALFHEDA